MISLNLNEAMRERAAEERREAKVRRAAKPKAEYPQVVTRRWDAARFTNLTSDWPIWATSANQDLRTDLAPLRARNRHLFQNNGVMKKFGSLCESNVIGGKMTLRVTFDGHGNSTAERDAELATYVEGKFTEWCRPENCTASGKLSFVGALAYMVRTMARDGEFLARELTGGAAPPDNEFGYALNFRDVAWLDEGYNAINEFGNRVLMSVEYNDYDRPIRYWLTRPKTDFLYAEYKPREAMRTPVPASEIIHKFLVTEDELQARGVPWGAAAMEPIHTLGGVVNAELYASRANACDTDYISPPANEDEDGEPTASNPVHPAFPVGMVREMHSAQMLVLPPGYKITPNDPKHPNANLGDFMKSIKRDIGAALLVQYESLANDREGVNYSSIRAGMLEDRDVWRILQLFIIDHVCHRIFQNWLSNAMLTGAVKLSVRDADRIRDSWRPRGWDWVDPLKDIQAAILAIMNGLESRTDYSDERGDDFLENVRKLKLEREAMEAAGLVQPATALAPAKPKAEMSEPGAVATGSEKDDGEEDVSRVLPIFEPYLLPRALGNASQPVIIVLNGVPQQALIDTNTIPPKPNGDSHLLDN